MILCRERCSKAEAERAGTLWGAPMRPSSGFWVRSRLGRASQYLGVVSIVTPALPSMLTRGWPPWTLPDETRVPLTLEYLEHF